MTIRSIKTIAVFCGSNYGASEEFADGARALGRALGKAGITIVYGGTTKGLWALSPMLLWLLVATYMA